MKLNVGIMQGRLSPPIRGEYQSFPSATWRQEFEIAAELGLQQIEWLVKSFDRSANPLWSHSGRKEIRRISEETGIIVRDVSGDVFMSQPLATPEGKSNSVAVEGLVALAEACSELGWRSIMIPFVDGGAFVVEAQKAQTVSILNGLRETGKLGELLITFESSESVAAIVGLLQMLRPPPFGMTYDSGDRVGIGADCAKEVALLGDTIANFHIKDKLVGGGPVCHWVWGPWILLRRSGSCTESATRGL